MTDWTTLRYAVVDVEGNGQQPPDLVELAVVPIVGGVIGEPVSWVIKPPRAVNHYATRIHGLTSKELADAPTFDEVHEEVRHALDADALVAHNARLGCSYSWRLSTMEARDRSKNSVLKAEPDSGCLEFAVIGEREDTRLGHRTLVVVRKCP